MNDDDDNNQYDDDDDEDDIDFDLINTYKKRFFPQS